MTEALLLIAGTSSILAGCSKLVSVYARSRKEWDGQLSDASKRFEGTATRVEQLQQAARELAGKTAAWEGWKPLEVCRTNMESQDCKSVYLRDAGGEPLPNYRPGQYLLISLPGTDGKPIRRCYSLSDVAEPHQFRLTVKRVPGGKASTEIVDSLEVGTVLLAQAPRGKFVIDEGESAPVTLIAAGIGITPMVSFAKHLQRWNPRRPVQLFYQFRDVDQAPLLEDVAQWAANHDRARLCCFVSQPRHGLPDWAVAQTRITAQRVLKYCDAASSAEYSANPRDGVFLICGPGPMVQQMRSGLQSNGIPAEKIITETFGVSSGSKEPTEGVAASMDESNESERATKRFHVKVRDQDTEFECAEGQTILEAAEDAGIDLPSGCRMGDCGECLMQCFRGDVEYSGSPSLEAMEAGDILTCIARPKCDLEVGEK